MQSDLLIPGGFAPSNFHLPPGSTDSVFIDGDTYNIAERIKEISPALHVFPIPEDNAASEGGKFNFAIVEHCDDGWERSVFKCAVLDGRVENRLRYLMAKPFDERFKELEAQEHRLQEDAHERELDELYENMGAPMWRQLDHDGFIPGGRGVSYPTIGVAAHGRRAR